MKKTVKDISEYILGSIKYAWYNLYTRKDEFDKSLSIDTKYYLHLNKEEQERYLRNLTKRRKKAHKRDLTHE